MKLCDDLPNSVTVNGRQVKVDLDFRNVLRMMEIMSRDDLMPEARYTLAARAVCKHPKHPHEVVESVRKLLFKESDGEYHEKVTDFDQDAGMIRAAFRQAYGIDLYRDRLHWVEFSELLNAIPEGSRYSEVVGIRARPLPAPTKWNQHERDWLIKAKHDVALRMTEEEQAAKYHADVGKIFAGLMNMIQRGETNG